MYTFYISLGELLLLVIYWHVVRNLVDGLFRRFKRF